MRIGLTFNLKPPGATGDDYEEYDSEETIAALEAAIASSGHQTVRLGWGEEMLDRLRDVQVDGVFNIAEGRGGRGRESQVPAVRRYIQNQEEHHKTRSFEDEFKTMLRQANITYDERFLWK